MKRIISLDIIKSISIFFVIVTHFIAQFNPDLEYRFLFSFYVDMAVPFFLITTGYTHCKSLENISVHSTIDYYNKDFFRSKLQRALIPYAITLFIEIVLMFFILQVPLLKFLHTVIKYILKIGAWGPGGYYPVVFFQIILWIPLMYKYFRRNPLNTFFITILLNITFEVFAHKYLTIQVYRMLSFRYLTFVLLGMFLYTYKDKISKTFIPELSFAIGFIYLIYVNYIDYTPSFFTWWTNTTMLSAFYAFSIIYYFLKLESYFQSIQKYLTFLVTIGKSSYHIFFVQMILYGPMQSFKLNLRWLNQYVNLKCLLILSIATCILFGCIWHRFEVNYYKRH